MTPLHCLVRDDLKRCRADSAPAFVEAGAPTDDELQALLQTVIARLMKLLTRRAVPIEKMGQTYLAEPDADGDDARTLRPLRAAAATCRVAFGPRAEQKLLTLRGAMPEAGALARHKQSTGRLVSGLSTAHLVMNPLEILQRLATLIPRPSLHLIKFHEVLAPSVELRALAVPQGPLKGEEAAGVAVVAAQGQIAQAWPQRIRWARLLKRVFGIDMQHHPNCGAGELKIIVAILERPAIQRILDHLGMDAQPPPKARAREPGPHFAA